MADYENGQGGGTASGTYGANGANGPWWSRLLLQVGVPSAIAMFLIWFMAGQLMEQLATTSRMMTQADRKMDAFALKTENQLDEIRKENGWKVALLRAICQNTAKTEIQREQCVK